MGELPRGTVTLLFSDIEGSTRLLQRVGERYAEVLEMCRHLLRTTFHQYHGHEVDTQVYRDNNVLYHTIIFCTIQYCSVLHEYLQQEATQSGLPTFPPVFPLGKRVASISKKLW